MESFKLKRKSYALVTPFDAVTLPLSVAKSGYDDIIEDATTAAETYVPSPKKSSISRSKVYSSDKVDEFGQSGGTVGKVLGSTAGAATGAAVGGGLAGTVGAGLGVRSAVKSGGSLGSIAKKGGKWGLIAAAGGMLTGGLLGGKKGNEVGESIGSSTGESVGKIFSATLKRCTYSKASFIKDALKTVTGKVKPILDKTPQPLKDVGSFAKQHKTSLIGGAVMGTAMTGASYLTDKAIQKDMIKNGRTIPNEKSYSYVSTAVKALKAAPEKILSGTSSLFGGGGRKGVQGFAKHMKGSTSETSKKIGQFIENHPKTALGGSIVTGLGITGATWGAGDKITNKVVRSVDKDAFKYTDSKQREIN